MANYVVESARTTNVGSDSQNDTFEIQTALGVTVQGLGGNDRISAGADVRNFNNASFGLGAGNDTLTLTGGAGNGTTFTFGAGNDYLSADGATFTASRIEGGGGKDTLELSATTFNSSVIGLNQGNDVVSATNEASFQSSQLNLGGGADTLFLSATMTAATINGGGGADFISAVIDGSTDGLTILGDVVGTEFYGNDTIAISAAAGITSVVIRGAGGADVISASNVLDSAATINGNFGKDSITLSAGVSNASALVGGGAGKDTISLVGITIGQTNIATINGGGGADLITQTNSVIASGAAVLATATFIKGGAGADTILIDNGSNSGANQTAQSVAQYDAVSESNLVSFDTISAFSAAAGSTVGTGGFVVSQDVASVGQAATNVVAGQFGVTNGVVAWSGDQVGITARIDYLDSKLNAGDVAVVSDEGAVNYLFVQGGATDGGTADDLVIKIGNSVTSITVSNNSSVYLNLN